MLKDESYKTKASLVRQLYPLCTEEFYGNLCVTDLSLQQLESEVQNVNRFNKIGFKLFQFQDSEIQQTIR